MRISMNKIKYLNIPQIFMHQVANINLFPPFLAKASATLLFLPPTATDGTIIIRDKLY